MIVLGLTVPISQLMFEIQQNHNYIIKYGGYSPEIFKLVPFGSKVLDLGCSTGALAKVLITRKNCQVIGIDIDEKSLKEASLYCEKVFKCNLDNLTELENLLLEGLFDVITLGDILEHLKYPGSLLRTLKKYLKNEGIVIASIPNTAFIALRIRFLFGNFSYSKKGGLMDEDHLRFFSFKTARQLFEEAGYNVKKIYGISIVKRKFWVLKFLAKIFPTLFALHIIIIAQKEKER